MDGLVRARLPTGHRQFQRFEDGKVCIVPGRIYWSPLSNDITCEFGDCNKAAYQICNHDMTVLCCSLFMGCNRPVCMDHIQLHMAFKEEGYIGERKTYRYVSGLHCRDHECTDKYKKAKFVKCTLVTFALITFLFGLGIIWAFPSDVFVWQD